MISSLLAAAAVLIAAVANVAAGGPAESVSSDAPQAVKAEAPQHLYMSEQFNNEKRNATEHPLPDQF